MSAKFLFKLKLVFREPFFLMQEPTEKPPLHTIKHAARSYDVEATLAFPSNPAYLADSSTASYISIVSHPVRTRQGPMVATVMADPGGMSTIMFSVAESQRPVILICGRGSGRSKQVISIIV